MKIDILLFSILMTSSVMVFGQSSNSSNDQDSAYIHTITIRSEKIVNTLGIPNAATAKQVTAIVRDQYRNLNTIYNDRDEQITAIKQRGLSKDETNNEVLKVQAATDKKVEALHAQFLSALSSQLSPEQVIGVKNGMTYNVLNVTYNAYADMIPSLTKEQKEQIMDWLVEAREHAMDGESSEKKHWWFGKYKGRINNYLSAQGYDITKERKQWEQRIKQREAKTQNQS